MQSPLSTLYKHSISPQPAECPLPENSALKDIHKGERCFILCNGPSIKSEDLSPLAGEITMSVSNFYKHPLYSIIHPAYHCVPDMFSPFTDRDASQWFHEMHSKTGNSTLFLGARQKNVVIEENLFPERKVHYLRMELPMPSEPKEVFDLAWLIPGVQSVSIMCLMVCLYMGFKKIYLLGVDHDTLWTNKYEYFFNRKEALIQDVNQDARGNYTYSRSSILEATYHLWQQYIGIRSIARANNVDIINLSQNSYLDLFEFDCLSQID